MKVRLTVDLDIPDEVRDFTEDELRQLIFDTYINYVVCKHSEDAVRWCAKGKVGSDNEDSTAKHIYTHHCLWSDASKAQSWTIERLDQEEVDMTFKITFETKDGSLIQDRTVRDATWYVTVYKSGLSRWDEEMVAGMLERDAREKGVRILSHTRDPKTGIHAIVEYLKRG